VSKARVAVLKVITHELSVTGAAARYGYSRQHLHRLLARYRAEGLDAVDPRSRRPKSNSRATSDEVRDLIIELRLQLTTDGLDAGPVTIAWHLTKRGHRTPSTSTIRRILHGADLINPEPRKRPRSSYRRFEASQPNECWQSDFTHWRLAGGTDIEILNWLDDHSRYLIACTAHDRVTGDIVANHMISCDPTDFFVVMAALSSGSADLQHCPAAQPANTPSSEPLDLIVSFDGLGRLRAQTGTLGEEPVSRSYTYDGLSRLATAVGPWETGRGESEAVTWSYAYDALGNLRSQSSSRPSSGHGDHRAWHYYDPSKPRFLSQFAPEGELWETISANAGGEPTMVGFGNGHWSKTLAWNALGKLHRYADSTYHYDAFGDARLTVTGKPGSSTSIVMVGDDFEYDIGAQRANKSFSIDGVRIATLATSYAAADAATPPALRLVVWHGKRIAGPSAFALLAVGLVGLASVTLRRRTPQWLGATGVGVLSCALVALPHAVLAATLSAGPGAYGRHAEPILALLSDHLGSIRAAATVGSCFNNRIIWAWRCCTKDS
jgi:transposase